MAPPPLLSNADQLTFCSGGNWIGGLGFPASAGLNRVGAGSSLCLFRFPRPPAGFLEESGWSETRLHSLTGWKTGDPPTQKLLDRPGRRGGGKLASKCDATKYMGLGAHHHHLHLSFLSTCSRSSAVGALGGVLALPGLGFLSWA